MIRRTGRRLRDSCIAFLVCPRGFRRVLWPDLFSPPGLGIALKGLQNAPRAVEGLGVVLPYADRLQGK